MTQRITEAVAKHIRPKETEYDIRDNELRGFLIRVQKSGNASYVLAYKNQAGKSKRYTIGRVGEITAAKARSIAHKLKSEIANGADPVSERQHLRDEELNRKRRTLRAFFDDRYVQYINVHHKNSSASIDRLSKFVERWGDFPLEDISLKQLEDYRQERIADGRANSTINRDLNALRGLFRLAREEGVIETTPFEKLKSLKVDKRPKTRFLSEAEEDRLIFELDQRQKQLVQGRMNGNDWREERNYEKMFDTSDYRYSNYLTPLVLIALKTGLRRSELLSLDWSDIVLEGNSQIYVRGQNTKNSQSRVVPLNDEAVSILKDWKMFCEASPVKSDLVFANPVSGNRMTEIGSAWDRVLKKADINTFRFHDLRHTFASKLAKKGVDLNTIRELMGHADITMTLRYAHLSPGHLSDAVRGI